ncbi:MAG: peroxiredoxin [candidate division Zixibacteria bacterium]
MSLRVGTKAPDFKMQGVFKGEFKDFSLSDYKGKWVVLFFYPLDFTFVCPTEIKEFSKRNAEFEKLNAKVLGASIDSVYSHKAWIDSELGELAYPLLSDITKKVSADYDILHDDSVSLRGTFIIDPEGVVRWMVVSDLGTGRSVKETLRSLAALQTGELCQIDWEPGEKTLGAA